MPILAAIAGVIAGIAALLVLVRLIRGPSLIDRVIASDVLLTTLLLFVGAEMVVNGHTRTIPLMVVLAATGVFGSVAVARFISRAGAADGLTETAVERTGPRSEGDDDRR